MLKKLFIKLIIWVSTATAVLAQNLDVPVVGKSFPEIVFQGVKNYHKKEFVIREQRGKWLIIDFWSLGCTSCFSVFRKIRDIKQVHGDKVSVLQVGKKDHDFNANIETIYDRISTNMKLKVPATYDTVLRKDWNVEAYPNIYIVDPEGILRFITDGRDMTLEKFNSLINNEKVMFYPSTNLKYTSFDVSEWKDNPDVKMMTLISASNGQQQEVGSDLIDISEELKGKSWTVAMVPLFALYNQAYFGRWSWGRYDTALYASVFKNPILELKDPSKFDHDYNVSPPRGAYNCYIKLPEDKVNASSFMHALQDALKNTFGYSATIESREMPVWQLIGTPNAVKNLRTKGGAPYQTPGSVAGGFVVRNQPMNELLNLLTANLPSRHNEVFVDGTGLKTYIDFSIEGDMTDFNFVQNELSKRGLTFVKRVRKMQVLVIRD